MFSLVKSVAHQVFAIIYLSFVKEHNTENTTLQCSSSSPAGEKCLQHGERGLTFSHMYKHSHIWALGCYDSLFLMSFVSLFPHNNVTLVATALLNSTFSFHCCEWRNVSLWASLQIEREHLPVFITCYYKHETGVQGVRWRDVVYDYRFSPNV